MPMDAGAAITETTVAAAARRIVENFMMMEYVWLFVNERESAKRERRAKKRNRGGKSCKNAPGVERKVEGVPAVELD